MAKPELLDGDRKYAKRMIDRVPWRAAAQDHKGHSGRIDFRVPPPVKRMVKIALEKFGTDSGWETDSDMCRWAMNVALVILNDYFEDLEISNYNRQVAVINTIVAEEMDQLAFGETLKRTETAVKEMFDQGRKDRAIHMLRTVRKQISEMDDDEWQAAWEQEFNRLFLPLIPKTISILPEHMIDDATEAKIARRAARRKAKR